LKLFEAPAGRVLEVYPEDAPDVVDDATVLSCPIYYSNNEIEPVETDQMQTAFLMKITAMEPWYNMAVGKRQRTTVGASGIDLESIGDFIYAFVKGTEPENPRQDISLVSTLKLAVEDLKAYYSEGDTSQPGRETISSQALKDWFWNETTAGKVLLE